MSTFIGQLIGFAVIVFIIAKWVAPLVKGLMVKQQEAIRVALAESAEAAKRLAEADAMHAKALADAEAEAGSVTGEAKQDSERQRLLDLADEQGQTLEPARAERAVAAGEGGRLEERLRRS